MSGTELMAANVLLDALSHPLTLHELSRVSGGGIAVTLRALLRLMRGGAGAALLP